MPSPVDPEQILSDAIDLIADEREVEAGVMLDAFIATLKGAMNGSDADALRHYYWGRALALMEEWEQALLRYEGALQVDSNHEESLREIAFILLDELDRPESAKAILEERLLKLNPGAPEYVEAVASAEALIRRREGREVQEWKPGEPLGGEDGGEQVGSRE
jgi:tetratricopeptide (TPR) repeat protein